MFIIENCEDSDTISTCSSNKTTSYSCLLRHNKDSQSRSNVKENSGHAEGTKFPDQTVLSSTSTQSTPLSNAKCINDKINICGCNSSVSILSYKKILIDLLLYIRFIS